MALTRKPVRTAAKKLMDKQDRSARGDSTASRTARITISTTPEVARAVEDAAWERRISRSRLIEEAVAAYLNL